MSRRVAGIGGALATALAAALVAGPATALTLGFEGYDSGDIVSAEGGVSITTENFNETGGHPDLGVAFDTTLSGTRDPDLEFGSGWAGGNLAPDAFLGNILIVQENDDCDEDTCRFPDDEGRRSAGRFTLDLRQVGVFTDFGFDIIDVDSIVAENGSVRFLLDGSEVAFYEFADFLDLGQGVSYGDNTANRVSLGTVGPYDEVVITMGGSGAVDNLIMTPEPGSVALLGLGLTGLGVAGRPPRRRRRCPPASRPRAGRRGRRAAWLA